MSEDNAIVGGKIGNAAKARAVSLIGRTILNRYRIVELVAMGGIAAVFRATKLDTGTDVAIKVLHPEAEGFPEMVERFEREAIAGKHILHPNVSAVHDFERFDDGSWFLVQEFFRGKTLREVIDKGPIPCGRAARIARQLASALTAAHDLGIVHRDVKPRNIMILDNPEETVQLIDFGLAKVPVDRLAVAGENVRNSLTQAGVVFGTVAYMAPEASLGMRVIDRRADLYALGVILYEMIAGKHPFTATEPKALFAQQRNAIPPTFAERAPGIEVPPALEVIVRRLLEKDPDTRYPHARSVIVALDAVIEELDANAPAPLATGSSGSRGLIFLAVGVVVAALAIVAWVLTSGK